MAFVDELFAALMSWAVTLSGYPAPAHMPEVRRISHEQLERLACDSKPCKVIGWHPPGDIIYIDSRLDLTGDIFADSIVVHEMVHFLQEKAGAYTLGCAASIGAEREAYTVQREFLVRYGDWRPAGATVHGTGCQ